MNKKNEFHLNFITFNLKGGGNMVLYLLHQYSKINKVNSTIKVLLDQNSNPTYLKKILFYTLSIFKLIFFFLTIRFKNKNEYIIFSDPLIAFVSLILPKKKRVFYAQSDDFNLHSIHDGHPKILVYLFNLIVKINSKYNFEKVFANSNFTKNIFLKFHDNIKVISPLYSIPNSVYRKTSNFISPFNSKYKYNKKLKIGAVGRSHKRKGIDDFIRISNKLDKQAEFILLSQENILKKGKFKKIITKDRLSFLDIFSKFDIFISTSSFEGFNLTILESLKMNIPVVAKDNGSVEEFIYGNSVSVYKDINQAIIILRNLINNYHKLNHAKKFIKFNANRFNNQKSFKKFINHIYEY